MLMFTVNGFMHCNANFGSHRDGLKRIKALKRRHTYIGNERTRVVAEIETMEIPLLLGS